LYSDQDSRKTPGASASGVFSLVNRKPGSDPEGTTPRVRPRGSDPGVRFQPARFAASAVPALLELFRFRNSEIKIPASTTLSRSTPVSIPRPFSI